MKTPIQAAWEGRQIQIFPSEKEDAPAVYVSMFEDSSRDVLEACEKLSCAPFHLVSISGLNWDGDLSPWPHDPVVTRNDHFTGGAGQYARFLDEQVIPFADKTIGRPSCRIIAGYSMGGLFALYAPYVTDAFSAVVSASGSVWYPDFVAYVRAHDFLKKPETIYLSLGDRESRSRNPYLRQVQTCMETLDGIYKEKGILSVFEENPGNHYQDASLRLAKGITWTLSRVRADQ